MYHGTEKERGKKIVAEQKMIQRIFNLDNPEHLMIFKNTELAYKKKSAFSSKIQKLEYSDGVIMNILFKNLTYGENYDAVEAVFPTVDLDEMLTEKSRFQSIHEYQIEEIDFDIYYHRLADFENFRKRWGTKHCGTVKYVGGQRGGKYGKWQKS